MKSSIEWKSFDDRLHNNLKVEADKARPMQDAMKLFLPMLLAGLAKGKLKPTNDNRD
jgi:hypothetical protein